MNFVVGITGGIGSGKSAVTARLEEHGITVVDADIVAREVVEPGTPVLDAIVNHFGSDILMPNGALNRAALRKIVFETPAEREWLESVTHPAIREGIATQLAAATSAYVVLSSPLLLESSQNSFAQYVVVVDVPEEVQLKRTCARDNNDETLVRSIMAAQLSRTERCAKADLVIDNSGDLEALKVKVDDLHQSLLKLSGAS